MSYTIHHAPLVDLDPLTLYAILKLRVDVFVVEQQCPYPDLDGADTHPETLQVWVEDDAGQLLATSRILLPGVGGMPGHEAEAGNLGAGAGDGPTGTGPAGTGLAGDGPDGDGPSGDGEDGDGPGAGGVRRRRIGRVCADPAARRTGASSAMMEAAVALCGENTQIDIDAQAYLEGWYERFGFVRCGEDFLEDDIVHLPMRRAA